MNLKSFNFLEIDQYCSSDRKVTDYRTWISGIEERHMNTAQSFYKLKQKVSNAIAGKIVVGHGLSHDFQALRLNHPEHMKRDSGKDLIFNLKTGLKKNQQISDLYQRNISEENSRKREDRL